MLASSKFVFDQIRNFKTQDGAVIDSGQSQRWLEDEVPSRKPRVSQLINQDMHKFKFGWELVSWYFMFCCLL